MANNKNIRILWKDIAGYTKYGRPSFMDDLDRLAFRQALIKTGYYQDELQIYDVEQDIGDCLVDDFVEAIKKAVAAKQST